MKFNSSPKAGFTLVEIMIVVAIISMLAAIAVPNFVQARTTSQINACVNNLRQIDGAKQQWALETFQAATATPTGNDIAPYLGRAVGGLVVNIAGGQVNGQVNCPANGTYTINNILTPPDCDEPGHDLP